MTAGETGRCEWCGEIVPPGVPCTCAATVRIDELERALRALRKVCDHQYRLALHRWQRPGPKDRAQKEFAVIDACQRADALLTRK